MIGEEDSLISVLFGNLAQFLSDHGFFTRFVFQHLGLLSKFFKDWQLFVLHSWSNGFSKLSNIEVDFTMSFPPIQLLLCIGGGVQPLWVITAILFYPGIGGFL